MLNVIRSFFIRHAQAGVSSLNHFCQKPLSTLITILIIATSLALPALVWVLTDNLGRVSRDWQQSGTISLYLKSSTDAEQKDFFYAVQNIPGVGQAVFKSPAEGLKELAGQEGMEDVLRYLPDNPLPSVIIITPAIVSTPAQIEQLFYQLKAEPMVEQAKLDIQWVNRLYAMLGFARHMADILMMLLAIAVIVIIGNTLRLVLYHRHEEIQLLKLIGAPDAFILRPFLYSGIGYGLSGAVIAVFIVNISTLCLGIALNKLMMTYQMHYPFRGMSFTQILLLTLFSTIIGWLGARLTVKRQIMLIEPCK